MAVYRHHQRPPCPLCIHQPTTYAAPQWTVIVVELVTPPELAPIVVVPIPLAVANPPTLGAFAIVATLEEVELQCVVSVTSCTVPSLKFPVATNCCVVPTATEGASGEIAIEAKVPLLTVRLVVPVIPDALARIVTLPFFFPCAMPELRT